MTASAKGLFRATGKTAKVEKPREPDDFYPTPPEPTLALLDAEGDRIRECGAVWEPAAGDGAMVDLIGSLGVEVFASDLVDRGCGAEIRSFYDFKTSPAKAIVTNPPFQECHGKAPWVLHALEHLCVEYLALLLPYQWPGAKERAATWLKHPPSRVYLMRWRVDFTGEGAPPMLNAWFVWDKQTSGGTELLMLDKPKVGQMELLKTTAA